MKKDNEKRNPNIKRKFKVTLTSECVLNHETKPSNFIRITTQYCSTLYSQITKSVGAGEYVN